MAGVLVLLPGKGVGVDGVLAGRVEGVGHAGVGGGPRGSGREGRTVSCPGGPSTVRHDGRRLPCLISRSPMLWGWRDPEN